jgi:AcrR family transcriptional regulator
MARTRDAAATRERILLAAEDVVLTDGVSALTLEKAAARAGVSKGGVLYHFGTRNDLVTAMVQRMADRFDAAVRVQQAADPGASYAAAYVEECLAEPTEEDERSERVGAALIAAIAADPDLLEPIRRAFAGWQAQIEAGDADPVNASIARLAADGLWLCEMFGIAGLSPALRVRVIERIRGMVS